MGSKKTKISVCTTGHPTLFLELRRVTQHAFHRGPPSYARGSLPRHWRYVQQELLALQVPEEVMLPGLPALHTVDEATICRRLPAVRIL